MISVCIATYNGEKYILEQVESILSQLDKSDEIIISDDGSKDETLKILSNIGDERVKIFHNKGKHGVVPNFENALNHSTGDVIFLSDQDDTWLAGKVEACINALSDCDLVIHNAKVNYVEGNYKDNDYYHIRHSGPGYLYNLWKNTYLGCCMAFKKEVKSYILPFPKHILWHDMWIALMVELKGKTKFIDGIYLNYRRHGDNASDSSEKSTFSRWFQFKYRCYFLYYTLIRNFLKY